MLGKKVRDAQGADMGLVVDVLVDRNGLPLGAVIDFGGFLGVGSRKIAIDWQLLTFNPDDHDAPIELSLNRAEVQAAPHTSPRRSRCRWWARRRPRDRRPLLTPANERIMGVVQQAYEANLAPAVPRSAERGLDWLNLFVANIQTGFGPFIAVYLTTQGWTQGAIGFALSIGTATSMASQVPAGAVVDVARRKSIVAAVSILAFTASAVMFALRPAPLSVYLAEILHGFSSCTLGPAIAAMSLAVAGQAMFGLRVGRNARYASIGNGLGAALMGACGYYVSNQAVFFLTAALTLPALAALLPLSTLDAPVRRDARRRARRGQERSIAKVLADRRLLTFAALRHALHLRRCRHAAAGEHRAHQRAGGAASLLIAACVSAATAHRRLAVAASGWLAERADAG